MGDFTWYLLALSIYTGVAIIMAASSREDRFLCAEHMRGQKSCIFQCEMCKNI